MTPPGAADDGPQLDPTEERVVAAAVRGMNWRQVAAEVGLKYGSVRNIGMRSHVREAVAARKLAVSMAAAVVVSQENATARRGDNLPPPASVPALTSKQLAAAAGVPLDDLLTAATVQRGLLREAFHREGYDVSAGARVRALTALAERVWPVTQYHDVRTQELLPEWFVDLLPAAAGGASDDKEIRQIDGGNGAVALEVPHRLLPDRDGDDGSTAYDDPPIPTPDNGKAAS